MKDIRLARLLVLFESETKGLKRDLAEAERAFARTTAFIKANPVLAMGALAAAAVGAGLKAAAMAREFDAAARKIAAVVPGATTRVNDLKRAVDQLATSKGLSSEAILGGFQTIAKEGVASIEALTKRFEIIQRAADATGGDFNTLATGLDQVLEVFGLTDNELERVAAQLAAIAKGRFPVEDLLAAFQAAAPTIRAAGIGFDEAAAALSRYVDSGLNAKQANSALKADIEKLGREALTGVAVSAQQAATNLEEFRQRAAAVEQTAERTSQRIKEAFSAKLRDIGGLVDRLILTPLQAAFVRTGGIVNGRLVADINALSGTRGPSILGVGVHAAGGAGGLVGGTGGPIATEEQKKAAEAFGKELREAAAKATASLIDDLLLQLEEFQARYKAAVTGMTAEQIKLADSQLHELQTQLLAVKRFEAAPTIKAVAKLPERVKLRDLAEEEAQALEDATETAKRYAKETEGRADAAERARRAVFDEANAIARAARGMLQLADSLGIVDAKLASALEGAIGLAENLKIAMGIGLDFSSAIGIIGGAAKLLSGLFGGGESAASKRDREIRQQNTEALRELTKTISGSLTGVTASAASAGVQALLGAGELGTSFTGEPGQVLNWTKVREILASLGLSFEEFQDLLREIKPDLRLNTSTVDNFIESLHQVQQAIDAIQFRAFVDSFAGQLAFLQARFDLMDITNPLEQLQALQELASRNSPLLQQLLGNVDLSTAGGRAEAERILLDILNRLNTPGGLTGTELGKLSPEDLLQLVKQWEDLIDQINQGTGTATGGPVQTTFGAIQGTTSFQADRLISIGVSQDVHLVEIRDLMRSFVPVLPPPVPGLSPAAGLVFNVTVQVEGAVDPGTAVAVGEGIGAGLIDQVNRSLGASLLRAQVRAGDVVVH